MVFKESCTYKTQPPENDDFEIGQWVLCTERKYNEIFEVDSMSADWLIDIGGKQYDPDFCEVIVYTDDPDVELKK